MVTTPAVWHPDDGGSGDDNHTRRGHYVMEPGDSELGTTQRNKQLLVTVKVWGQCKSIYLQTVFNETWLTID